MSNDDERDEIADDDVAPPRQANEGVRILGAQEAAEATGRHDVVRKRERGKKYGDRPDTPDPGADLPLITISSSEPPNPEADRFGPVPIVPPPSSAVAQPPADEPRWSDSGDRMGHARVADEDDAPGAPPEPTDPAPLFDEPAADEDDSFVLPHWTEPATGQVPKVVIDADDEPLSSTGGQPRWRDEGERTSETRFDDLVGEGPSLGVLGDQSEPSYTEDDFFEREADHDPLEAFAPDEEMDFTSRPRRGSRGSGRPPSGRSGDGEGGADRNLPMAVAVGVGLIVVGLLCFKLGTIPTMLLAAVIIGVASFEYFTAVREVGYTPATLVGMVATVSLVVGAALSGLAAYPVVLGITVMVGLIWYLLVSPGEGSVPNLSITMLGVMWIGLLGSFGGLFLGLGKVVQDRQHLSTNPGIGVLIAAVIAAVSYDVGGYFIGRQFGHTPLSAASPNKTQEGFFGGLVVSLVVTIVAVSFISPIGDGIGQTIVFALLCAIAAPVGDLCESFVKRDLGIKDMGAALPGHGGVLDRFDSLLFVLPVAYFVTVLLGIWR